MTSTFCTLIIYNALFHNILSLNARTSGFGKTSGKKVENLLTHKCEVLEKVGFEVNLIPVIQFNFVRSIELGEKLKSPSEYAAMVLTSKRAVEAVKNVKQLPLKSDLLSSAV